MTERPYLVAATALQLAAAPDGTTAVAVAQAAGITLSQARRVLRALERAGHVSGTRSRPGKPGTSPIVWRTVR